ncbi:hypothetical protein J5S49_07990 [Virgibacillus halodenitrificans]|uniref:hypothetical protein n=1 Tax=Virgibacillus halodenitrificans TaxID=1482 RepID=UPI001F29ED50|nr:hypothetical protein [Virgibacillus halodenitrificans]MCG1028231.1 hypothetical protein [Virgibacillus halodenitrificans]
MIRKIDTLRTNLGVVYLILRKWVDSLISIPDERFPPAWLQPLPPLRSVQGLQLMLFRQESSSSIPINWYQL